LKDLKKYCDDNGYKISTYISKLVRDAINKWKMSGNVRFESAIIVLWNIIYIFHNKGFYNHIPTKNY
jgi:hypothetical protein